MSMLSDMNAEERSAWLKGFLFATATREVLGTTAAKRAAYLAKLEDVVDDFDGDERLSIEGAIQALRSKHLK
jgi:hypothetical protein